MASAGRRRWASVNMSRRSRTSTGRSTRIPTTPRPFTWRGRAWAGLGDYRRAVADFTTSLHVRPLQAEVYYHSGLANRELGNLAEAKADLEKAFQLDPLVDQRK